MKRITLLTNPDVCNLKCPLCFLQQRGHLLGMGEMSFEIVKHAIETYGKNLREVIPSTMGEPLLYSKFKELLDLCQSKKIPLNLTTNGTFPKEWGSVEGMNILLQSCSDIKISTLSFENPCFGFEQWKKNVEQLLKCRNSQKDLKILGTVSLQVTLHKKNLSQAENLMHWAESVGIHRIKWNPVVFLSVAPKSLKENYEINDFELESLRKILVSKKLICQGTLFTEGKKSTCPFKDEIWILPDGTVEHCPNPERRFGNPHSQGAQCESCVMFNRVKTPSSILNLNSKPENFKP